VGLYVSVGLFSPDQDIAYATDGKLVTEDFSVFSRLVVEGVMVDLVDTEVDSVCLYVLFPDTELFIVCGVFTIELVCLTDKVDNGVSVIDVLILLVLDVDTLILAVLDANSFGLVDANALILTLLGDVSIGLVDAKGLTDSDALAVWDSDSIWLGDADALTLTILGCVSIGLVDAKGLTVFNSDII
jgi:hypothetical protein